MISHFSFPSSSSSVVNGGWAGLSKRRFLAYLPFQRFQAGCRRLIPLPQSLPAVLSNFRVVFTRFPAFFFPFLFGGFQEISCKSSEKKLKIVGTKLIHLEFCLYRFFKKKEFCSRIFFEDNGSEELSELICIAHRKWLRIRRK